LNCAVAVTEYVPAATFAAVKVYGLVIAMPTTVEFALNVTSVTVPVGLDTVATSAIVAGAVKVPLAADAVSVTAAVSLFCAKALVPGMARHTTTGNAISQQVLRARDSVM
jgi:hypothetical protein